MKQFFLFTLLLIINTAVAQVRRYDVIITEIMADPSPQVALPNAEYLEIRNVSKAIVDLYGWKISDAGSMASVSAHFMLHPDSAVILCSNSNAASLSAYGRTLGVSSFPSLDNDGDLISLKDPAHSIIHAVQYDPSWYKTESKRQGGWSLEMIDPSTPCAGIDNWKASIHDRGGTPGKVNSVTEINADERSPMLIRAYSPDSLSIVLVLNETVDSVSAATVPAYQSDGIQVVAATALPPLYTTILLRLATPLLREKIYLTGISGIKDCNGNLSDVTVKIKAGLPSRLSKDDVVINEILFDPRSGAYDYVEIFNRSNKVIDMNELHLGNRDINGAASTVKKIADRPFYIFPGEYMAVTEDKMNLAIHYLVKEPGNILQIPQLPSYPDDEGFVLLLDQHGNIVDEVPYADEWHFGLITEAEGISLERIDPSGAAEKKDNWHSASFTSGYGTPGYENSQYRSGETFDAAITLSPKIFSPDNDGLHDVLTINYQMEEQGFVASIIVFDMAGRPVRWLVKNDLLAFKGTWTWDGLDEQKKKIMIGTYIVMIEIFNLKGKRKVFKERIVLARK